MPRPRKYKDSGDRYNAFLQRHPDYQKNYQEEHSDRLSEYKSNWYRKNTPLCPKCTLCGARLKSEQTRAFGFCRACQRKGID